MDCPWKTYVDIESFFSTDINLNVHFCTADHVVGKLNAIETNLVVDVTGENHLIGREIKTLGIESFPEYSRTVIAQHNMVLKQKRPLQFYSSVIIKNKYQADFSTIRMPIYSKPGKLEGVFGFSTCSWKFSIENAIKKGFTKREIECLFLYLKKYSTKKIACLLNLQVRTVEAYFEEIKAKLKCYNRSHITEEAVKAKIIDNQDSFASCDLFSSSYYSLFKNNILTKVF